MNSLTNSIRSLTQHKPSSTIWIGGDFNLPDIQWEDHQITGHSNTKFINEPFLTTCQDLSLEQTVQFPTRCSNILDIFLSNRSTLINRVEPMPDIRDHDIMVYINTSIKPFRQHLPRIKITLWKHTDMAKLRSDIASLLASMLRSYSETTPVNTLWNVLRQGIGNIMESAPSKISSTRFSPPWMNSNIKRLA